MATYVGPKREPEQKPAPKKKTEKPKEEAEQK